jgi:hypothetical protein
MNLKESIQKIWKDPVWSKVISVGIIALITFIYTLVSSVFNNISIGQSLKNIFDIKIRLIYIVSIWILYYLGVKVIAVRDKYDETKRKTLQEFNRMEDNVLGMLFMWKVHFNGDTPFISDLTAFCTDHEVSPIRFMNEKCPVKGCKNNPEEDRFDLSRVENYIESQLIERWNRMKMSKN